MKTLIRPATTVLVLCGLLALALAALLTPGFVARHASADHVISTVGLARLSAYRVLSALAGASLCLLGFGLAVIRLPRFQSQADRLRHLVRGEPFVVAMALLVGAGIRSFHLFIVGIHSPYKFGGLFLQFANEIIQNGFLIPRSIPFYTNGGIPFAYPPLPFYVEAFLIHFLNVPPFAAVNLLPAAVAILSLPAFYLLTRSAGLGKWPRGVALAGFALLPNAFLEQVEGAGLAEAFGTLALILFLAAFLNLRNRPSYKQAIVVGLTWALCVLTSPGSAFASVLGALILAEAVLYDHREGKTILLLVLAGITALAVSSPYWLTVAHNHGFGVFAHTLLDESNASALAGRITAILDLRLVTAPFCGIWNVLIFLSAALGLLKRRFLPVALLLILALIPRESPWMLSIPAALLLGIGLEVLLQWLASHQIKITWRRPSLAALAILVVWTAIGPVSATLQAPFSSDATLHAPYLQAMEWIKLHTAPDSRVIVIADSEPQAQEWLPEIARRTVVNEPYGSEWQPKERAAILQFEAVRWACGDPPCVVQAAHTWLGLDEFILFIERDTLAALEANPPGPRPYARLWENSSVVLLSVTAR